MSPYETRLFINNRYVEAVDGGGTFSVKNPVDDSVVCPVAAAGAKDIDAAVQGAEEAQFAWAQLSSGERIAPMRRLADLLVKHNDTLALLDGVTMGRPVASNTQGTLSAHIWNYFAALAENIHGTSSLSTPGFLNVSLRQPFGVTAGIIPWNFPVSMFSFKAAPAVAAGNSIIIKTSEKAPLAVGCIGQLVAEAGFPPGVIQILHGAGQTGQLLSRNMRIRKLSFTGSTRTGRAILTDAANSNMKNVTLELGGKSPTIIFDDADIAKAAEGCAFSIAFNSGQVCIASSRVYVQDKAYDRIVAAMQKAFQQFRHGDSKEQGTSMGPQADAGQSKVVRNYLSIGKSDGTLLAGGETSRQNFFSPALFVDVPETSRLNREEVFGPVVVVHKFTEEDEAIRRCNDSEFGLYAAVYTSDVSRALRVAKALESGSVGVNCNSPMTANDMPFGGYKASGMGRENGPHGLDAWLEHKSVYIRVDGT